MVPVRTICLWGTSLGSISQMCEITQRKILSNRNMSPMKNSLTEPAGFLDRPLFNDDSSPLLAVAVEAGDTIAVQRRSIGAGIDPRLNKEFARMDPNFFHPSDRRFITAIDR